MRPIILATIALCAAACAKRQPAAVAAPQTPPAAAAGTVVIDYPRACVILDGELKILVVQWDPRTEELTYQGLPLAQAFPVSPDYAAAHDWYPRSDSISFQGRTFRKYGVAREIPSVGLERVGEYRGVGVYADSTLADFIALPTRPQCVFQVYLSDRVPLPGPR